MDEPHRGLASFTDASPARLRCGSEVWETVNTNRISDLKWKLRLVVVLGAILALALAASASSAQPFPRIARDGAVSCSRAKAKVWPAAVSRRALGR
jgi:hypothetical protein